MSYTWYVSPDGHDALSGLTPDLSLKTFGEALNRQKVHGGEIVVLGADQASTFTVEDGSIKVTLTDKPPEPAPMPSTQTFTHYATSSSSISASAACPDTVIDYTMFTTPQYSSAWHPAPVVQEMKSPPVRDLEREALMAPGPRVVRIGGDE